MANDETILPEQKPMPDPELRRLDKLVGKWSLRGRTLDAQEDNISGRTTIGWLPGGFFLELRGEMEFQGFKSWSLEVISYDLAARVFSSTVYSDMGGVPMPCWWDIQGDVVTHWMEGSKYTGTFSEDGNVLIGSWRPEEGKESTENVGYDAIMIRVQDE